MCAVFEIGRARQNPREKGRRVRRVAALLVVMILLLAASLLVELLATGSPSGGFKLGATELNLEFEADSDRDEWFEHNSWRNGLGELEVSHQFYLRVPGGTLLLELDRDPVSAARKRSPGSVDGLIQWLNSDNPAKVYAAGLELAAMQAAALPAFPHLLRAVERTPGLFFAISPIAQAEPRQTVPHLITALQSTNAELRSAAINMLGALRTVAAPAVPALRRTFTNAPAADQAQLAFALWQITDDCSATLPTLRRTLQQSSDPDLQAHLMLTIGNFGGAASAAVPDLVRFLESERLTDAARWSAMALAQIGQQPENCVRAISVALARQPPFPNYFRMQAIGALGKFGASAVPPLLQIYQGTNAQETYNASRALMEIGPPAAEGLAVYLQDLAGPRTNRAEAAALILSRLGPAAAPIVPVLRRLVQSPDVNVRARAACVLARVSQPDEELMVVLLEALGQWFSPQNHRIYDTIMKITAENPELKDYFDRKLRDYPKAGSYVRLHRMSF